MFCAGASRTMKRVYEKKEFEQVAKSATRAAPQDAERRFHVPIVGTLTCTYAGTAEPDQEFIVWDTQVFFCVRYPNPPHEAGHVRVAASQPARAEDHLTALDGT